VSLHNYLQRLEQSPWRMFWWRGRLAADDDARLVMTVTIYTLSLDRAWLQV
jgi:MSHA biogenesis protein MshJ